ncbi:MAG: ATP-binding protein [bacterium]
MNNYISRKIEKILQRYANQKETIVLTGFRRVGKTFVIQHIYEQLATSNKIYLDLESPVNQKIFENDNYDNITLQLSALGLDFSKKVYIFLDEIQKSPNLPSAVKYLYDHYDIKFYLTGSSSFYLKNYFNESMAGRKFVFEMYPLDFEEFLLFKGEKLTINANYDRLSGFYKEYLDYGGFPSVVLESSSEKKTLKLDDILGSYFELDVAGLSDFKDNKNLKNLMFLLAGRVGGKADVTKLSQSLGVSRPTIYEYLTFFEQTYLIHLIKPFSGSRDVEVKSLAKIYFNDTGLLNRIGQVSLGQLFENKVFNQLYTKGKYNLVGKFAQEMVKYYQLKSGAEIDFIYDGKTGYEVKTTGTDNDTRRVAKTAKDLGLKEYRVVSLEKTRKTSVFLIYPFKF